MPYDVNGTYTLPSPEYPFIPNTLADANDVNTVLADIRTALNSAMLRSGVAPLTGPLKLADGTALLPGLTFSADANTGLYRIGADSMGLAANGTLQVTVDSTGTTFATAPSYAADPGSANVLARKSYVDAGDSAIATKLSLSGGTLTGNLGIGGSPTSQLDLTAAGADVRLYVRAATGFQGLIELAGNGQVAATTSLAVGQDGSGDAAVFQRANRKLYFATNAVERMTIGAIGTVSIGGGFTDMAGDLGISRPSAPGSGVLFFGNVSGKYLYYTGSQFDFVGGIVQASNFTATSDARLKRDIRQIDGALDKLSWVRGVTFERIDEPGRRQTGVLAQELQTVLPEAVSTFIKDEASGGTEEYLTVNHGSVIGLLIEAIKELNAKVEALS